LTDLVERREVAISKALELHSKVDELEASLSEQVKPKP
jgi:hypothetical protein